MTELYNTESPIDRKRRNNINATWDDILSRFANLQRQINILAGGQEVDELIARLEQAIKSAEIDVQNYIIQVDESVQQAIKENNNALQTALQTVSETLDELNIAISKAETATEDATNAKNATIQATQDAQEAINTMQSLIDNFSHRGAWSSATQYYKNNLAEVDGRTYIALKENINTLVTNKSSWSLFADKGVQGAEGPRGLPGKDGKDGTGVNIIGGLTSEDELPTVGTPGDAYMIGGDLYVWQDDTGSWKNVGPIQGPEGKSAYDLAVENGFEGTLEEWIESLKGDDGPGGPVGPPGPPGKDADLTEVTEQLDQMKPKVDNSWQKGVYNDTDITNLSSTSISRVFYMNDWTAPANNIEQASIVIPVENFNGTVKISVAGAFNNTNGSGAFEYENFYLKVGDAVYTNKRTIYKADENIASQYYFLGFNKSESLFTIPIVRAPHAFNRVTVKVEILTTFPSFEPLKNAYVVYEDFGTSWHGYPWTPQTTSFAVKNEENIFTNQSPIVMKVQGQPSHLFHKNNDRLYLTPSASVETTDWRWDLATEFFTNGDVSVKGRLLVDGVDLKQSVSDGKSQVASAITGKGVQTASDATFETMANNIRAIPTGSRTQSGSMQIPAFSGSQTVSVNVYLPFVAKNALNNMGGLVFLNGYPYGAMGVAGPYTSNITVAGTTLTFTFAMGGGTGSFAGGTGAYFASE